MQDKKRTAAIFIMIAALTIGTCGLASYIWKGIQQKKAHDKLTEQVVESREESEEAPTETTEPEAEEAYVSPIDFKILWERNEDVAAWLQIPGTQINYPVVHGEDNDYYLHHDLYGNYSEYGTIFLDARVPSDFSGHNNVLYGHHMSDGSMFASISNYKQQWYYDDHAYFLIYTNAGKYRVDLFAGIVVPGTHEVFSTSLSADQLQRFINNSTFYSGKGVPSGQIVTLCTCSYEAANYRYVVLGELVKLEDTPADTATEAAA